MDQGQATGDLPVTSLVFRIPTRWDSFRPLPGEAPALKGPESQLQGGALVKPPPTREPYLGAVGAGRLWAAGAGCVTRWTCCLGTAVSRGSLAGRLGLAGLRGKPAGLFWPPPHLQRCRQNGSEHSLEGLATGILTITCHREWPSVAN